MLFCHGVFHPGVFACGEAYSKDMADGLGGKKAAEAVDDQKFLGDHLRESKTQMSDGPLSFMGELVEERRLGGKRTAKLLFIQLRSDAGSSDHILIAHDAASHGESQAPHQFVSIAKAGTENR
jgi:hypothetical protein